MEYKDIVEIAVEAIDWKTNADEWLYRVGECMTEVGGYTITGHRYDMTTQPFTEVTSKLADSTPHDTQFLVLPLDDGVLIATGTREGDQPSEPASEAWARAVRCATERLGTAVTSFDWTALLGTPLIRIGEVAINNDATVGPFRISSAGRGLRELLPPQMPSLNLFNVSVSWPILVEGEHDGYNWPAASKKAAFELHRLTGLLSVALGECVVVREAPAPREHGVRRVPDHLPGQKLPDGPYGSELPEPQNVKPLPDWLPEAWTAMHARPAVGHAVDAHHEGMRAQLEHPHSRLWRISPPSRRCPTCCSSEDIAPNATPSRASQLDFVRP